MRFQYTIAVHFLEESEETEEVPRRQLRDKANVLNMPTNQFVGNFRVSKEVFVNMLDVLQDKWAQGYRSTKIRPDIKLATFLRFVATGSYQQTVGNECISSTSKPTVARIITECLQLFEEWICPRWIQMPGREEEHKIVEAFFESTGFPGVVGCVDGTHIRIKSPGQDLMRLYYNRKGYCSLNVMVVCDHKLKVRFVDARHPGANHDAFIWEHSVVDAKMQAEFDRGKRNVWILGDGGYTLKPFLMTPFRSPNDVFETRYNKKHASTRNVVERCFGVLKNRFRCIIGSRGLHYGPEKAIQIVNACCALHNMCIEDQCEDINTPQEDIASNDLVEAEVEQDSRALAIRRGIALNL